MTTTEPRAQDPASPTTPAKTSSLWKGNMTSTVSTTTARTDSSISTTAIGKEEEEHIDWDRLVAQADKLIQEECLLAAARILRPLQQQSSTNDNNDNAPQRTLTPTHLQVLAVADDMEASCADLLHDPDDSWIKQSETKVDHQHHHQKKKQARDTVISYKVDGARLECRVDCVMETSLLVPFLSVLNETNLYDTWIPSWTTPVRLGVQDSTQLQQVSRGHQIVHVTCNVPWPLYARDVVLRATACDDIDAHQAICVRMKGMHNQEDDPCVPDVPKSVVRADFEGAILIRPCPESKWSKTSRNPGDDDEENRVLVSFKMFMDPHLSAIPISVINFVTRTVIHTMWNMLLQVAEGVRDGKRPLHAKAIQEKPDLYEWIEARINVLLGQMEEAGNDNGRHSQSTAAGNGMKESAEDNSHELIAYLQT